MAYAPILDPSAYAGKQPWRRISVAAAGALQHLAADDAGALRTALGWLEEPLPETGPESLHERLARLEGVQLAITRSGVADKDLLPRLVQQLRQVKSFGELDGGHLDDYIGPVARLIRSGRVELFAG